MGRIATILADVPSVAVEREMQRCQALHTAKFAVVMVALEILRGRAR